MHHDPQWAADHFNGWLTARRRRLVVLTVALVPVLFLALVALRVGALEETVPEAAASVIFGTVALSAVIGLMTWWLGPLRPLAKVGRLRPVRLLEADEPDVVRVVGDAGVALQWRVGRSQGRTLPAPGELVWATEPVARGAYVVLVVESAAGGCRVVEPRGPSWRPPAAT